MEDKFTLSIYLAVPGTPLKKGGSSAAGHMYFDVTQGKEEFSYGFAPIAHGVMFGAGEITSPESPNYINPHYTRTMEITQAQYEKLNVFAKNPGQFGFNLYYTGNANSCIDFTWAALNYAGIHTRVAKPRAGMQPNKEYQGALKPIDNINDIRKIAAPFPGSPLNSEETRPLPPRTLMQKLLTENDRHGVRRYA